MVRCKCIICQLTDMVEHELSNDIYDDIMEHIRHCPNCGILYNTFVKTINLCHSIEKVKLPANKKKVFHKWMHVEVKKIVVKRARN